MTDPLDTRGILVFCALSLAGAWLLVSPLWFSPDGLASPYALPLMVAMMWTPAISAFVVTQWVSPMPDRRRRTGIVLGENVLTAYLFAFFAWPVFCLATPFVGALFGVFELDLAELSGFRDVIVQTAGQQAADELFAQMPIHVLAAAQLLNLGIAPLINAPAVFGEEYGWRGYLLPALLPLGQWPALLLSGVIWGLWHAPVILLGYNYPSTPVLGVLLMTVLCVVHGTLMGWTRLVSGSVWPAVIAHGALNGGAGVVVVFMAAGSDYNAALAGVTGVTGWLVPMLVIGALAATGRLPVSDAPDTRPLTPGSSESPDTAAHQATTGG